MSQFDKNYELLEFLNNNYQALGCNADFAWDVTGGKYRKIQISVGENSFVFDLENSKVIINNNKKESGDIANFEFGLLSELIEMEKYLEDAFPVVKTERSQQHQTPMQQPQVSKTPVNPPKKLTKAEIWQNEIDNFLLKIMPNGEYKGKVSTFSLKTIENGISISKIYRYDDVKKSLTVEGEGPFLRYRPRKLFEPEGDIKKLRRVLDKAQKGLEMVEEEGVDVKFQRYRESPNTSFSPNDARPSVERSRGNNHRIT